MARRGEPPKAILIMQTCFACRYAVRTINLTLMELMERSGFCSLSDEPITRHTQQCVLFEMDDRVRLKRKAGVC